MWKIFSCLAVLLCAATASASAGWSIDSGSRISGAGVYTGDVVLERQCDAVGTLASGCTGVAHSMATASVEMPSASAFCGNGTDPGQIEYVILEQSDGEWDALVTVDGRPIRAMTAYSYFGNSRPPEGFVVALLAEDGFEVLVFTSGGVDWLTLGDNRYEPCT
jgi:hypothetical protein